MEIDKIFSKKLGCELATIIIESISSDKISYKGKIIENQIPIELLNKILEYEYIINNQMFSILDRISREINSYGLYLNSNKKKIFDVYINDNVIEFSLKFLTSTGYMDDYPLSSHEAVG